VEVHVCQGLLHLIDLVGDDLSTVLDEALNLWLKGTPPLCALLVVTRNYPRGGFMSNAAGLVKNCFKSAPNATVNCRVIMQAIWMEGCD